MAALAKTEQAILRHVESVITATAAEISEAMASAMRCQVSETKMNILLTRLVNGGHLDSAMDGDALVYFVPLTPSECLAFRYSQVEDTE